MPWEAKVFCAALFYAVVSLNGHYQRMNTINEPSEVTSFEALYNNWS